LIASADLAGRIVAASDPHVINFIARFDLVPFETVGNHSLTVMLNGEGFHIIERFIEVHAPQNAQVGPEYFSRRSSISVGKYCFFRLRPADSEKNSPNIAKELGKQKRSLLALQQKVEKMIREVRQTQDLVYVGWIILMVMVATLVIDAFRDRSTSPQIIVVPTSLPESPSTIDKG
jgi:hypothetical protein